MAKVRLKYVMLADHISMKLGKMEPREYFRVQDKVKVTLHEEQNRVYFEYQGAKKSVHESLCKTIEYFTVEELTKVLADEKAEEEALARNAAARATSA